MTRSRAAAAAAVLVPALLLAGCSGLPDLTPHRRQGTAATPAALELAWSTPASQPGWLPADAVDIRWTAATTGGADRSPAALLARTSSPLPGSCRPVEDAARAAISAAWAPDAVRGPVRRCGGWAVVAVDGGYYGWTPVQRDAQG